MRPKEAKKILPKSEYEAFEAVLMNQSRKMGPKKLMQRATLSRRLRDKYRDLSRRQAAGVRTRRTNTTDTRLNDRKAQIFQDIIDHLETELERPRTEAPTKKPKKSRARFKSHELNDDIRRTMREARRRAL